MKSLCLVTPWLGVLALISAGPECLACASSWKLFLRIVNWGKEMSYAISLGVAIEVGVGDALAFAETAAPAGAPGGILVKGSQAGHSPLDSFKLCQICARNFDG